MRQLIVLLVFIFGLGGSFTALSKEALAPNLVSIELIGEQTITLEQFRGQVVLLDFWASWCGPCRRSLPEFEVFYQAHKQDGLAVVAVNMDENPQDGRDFVATMALSYTLMSRPESKQTLPYQLEGLPVSYLLDQQGRVVQRYVGFNQRHWNRMQRDIKALLKAEP